MSQHDGITPKYEAGFADAVKRLQGAHPGTWGTTYTPLGALEQALRQAYHQGRMDGVTEALGHPDAPRPVNDEPEVSRLTQEEVWADLGLFEAADAPPLPLSIAALSVTLDPIDGDPHVWAVQQARTTLGLSLVEADEFVTEVLG
jgi:hypothetical protein